MCISSATPFITSFFTKLITLTFFVLQNIGMLFDDDHASVTFAQRRVTEKKENYR